MKQYALLIAVMLGAGALGFGLYQWIGGNGESSGAMADAPSQLTETLPSVTMPDPQGEQRSLDEWAGDILVINFWGTWCAPCREEVPLLVDLQADYEDEDVTVIGIALDRAEPVRRFSEEYGINYPLLVGEDEALTALEAFGSGTLGLPHTFVVDRDGNIVNFHLGLIEPADVEGLLAPALGPTAGD
jgi:peroxiredoxin